MRIVIAGAGAVGTHLAKLLSRERHDIVLLDENPGRLETIGADFDLMTLASSPLSITGLREAGTPKADLFIGVTPDEAHNMTCCMLAHKLGAKRTVARVDSEEYTLPDNAEFFRSVGIDSIIYPEMLAGQEIMSNIRRSWARQWWEVHGGALIMVGVKVRTGARVLNIPLRELCTADAPYHVVAIKRDGDTIIPHGDDSLLHGDMVYFMTTRKHLPEIKHLCGKDNYEEIHSIMIVGGGRVAVQTARMLSDRFNVKIIEISEERAKKLTTLVDENVMVIHGDGRNLDLLIDEDIKKTQAFIALTGSAETNILACLAAKRLGVRKTAAIVENLDYAAMAESLDIGTIINKKAIAAGHIYQMMLDVDVSNLKCLTVSAADVVEFVAAEKSKATRKLIKDLDLPKGATIGGLVRNGEGILVSGDTQIQSGDSVVVFCVEMDIRKLEHYFN